MTYRAHSIDQLFKTWLRGVSRRSQLGRTVLAILVYGMWEIWKVRCRMKYEEAYFDGNQLLRRIYEHVYDINRIHRPKREPTTIERIYLEGMNIPIYQVPAKRGKWLCWKKPDRHEFKLNVDGSLRAG